jgi:hypothetical protein
MFAQIVDIPPLHCSSKVPCGESLEGSFWCACVHIEKTVWVRVKEKEITKERLNGWMKKRT